jgi:hypothetical protein
MCNTRFGSTIWRNFMDKGFWNSLTENACFGAILYLIGFGCFFGGFYLFMSLLADYIIPWLRIHYPALLTRELFCSSAIILIIAIVILFNRLFGYGKEGGEDDGYY